MTDASTDEVPESRRSRRGFLAFIGSGLIVVGALSFALSLLGVAMLLGSDREIITPGGVPLPFDTREGSAFARAGAAYLAFQLWSGLLYGPLAMIAGALAARTRSLRTVWAVSWISLIYFPMGTTVGFLALNGLRRPEVRRVFDQPASPGA